MKVALITGANSFIGLSLVRRLTHEGFCTYSIVRKSSQHKEMLQALDHNTIIELDMDSIDATPDYLEHADIFYHLAWEGTRGASRDNASLQHRNYLRSMSTLRIAERLGCSTFISAGSQAEYGIMQKITDEQATPSPVTEYGVAKLQFYNEALTFCDKHGIKLKEPRFFSLYGPGDFENSLIMYLIRSFKNNEPVDLTAGTQLWNYLYIDDAIEGMIQLATVPCADGVYNFGSDDTRELRMYIEELRSIMDSKSTLHYGATPYHPTGIINIAPDNSKLKRETNWTPKVSFETGVNTIIKHGELLS